MLNDERSKFSIYYKYRLRRVLRVTIKFLSNKIIKMKKNIYIIYIHIREELYVFKNYMKLVEFERDDRDQIINSFFNF